MPTTSHVRLHGYRCPSRQTFRTSLQTTKVKPYTIEELDQHLEEAELEFASGDVLSMEEADADMDNFAKSLL